MFQPHPFEPEQLKGFISKHYRYQGFLLEIKEEVIGYAACYLGHFEHDMGRFKDYDFPIQLQKDAQFAPIIRPDFRGKGAAQQLLNYAASELAKKGITRLFLWGGVKTENKAAIRYYRKNGFQEIGQFEHYGQNLDMYLPI